MSLNALFVLFFLCKLSAGLEARSVPSVLESLKLKLQEVSRSKKPSKLSVEHHNLFNTLLLDTNVLMDHLEGDEINGDNQEFLDAISSNISLLFNLLSIKNTVHPFPLRFRPIAFSTFHVQPCRTVKRDYPLGDEPVSKSGYQVASHVQKSSLSEDDIVYVVGNQ